MTFTENWFGTHSQRLLKKLIGKVADLDGAVIEVGCWEGRSTVALANEVYPAKVIAVDTWQGSPGEISAELAAERDVFATFTDNIGRLTRGNVYPVVRGCWRPFFAAWNAPIRFLFIDAEHSYDAVYENIVAALPFMVDGGIICGDDAAHPPVREAVLDALPENEVHVGASLWWWQR